jgi:alcohol dehydrogenase class IV
MVNFELCSGPRIVFGRGGIERLGALVAELGGRPALVRDSHVPAPVLRGATAFEVRGEPTRDLVDRLATEVRDAGCDVVVGVGGGSTIDTAKAVAALAVHGGEALDYLEVVGRGRPLPGPGLPCVAVPTTAGTGSEVTRNAVITCAQERCKASLRSVHLVPRIALVDPALTHGVPADVTASTGLDALTQLIEPYVCTRAQPMTDALCLVGLRAVVRSLRRAVYDGADAEAREDLSLAALLSGMCLANAGLGAVHGFAAPLGAVFPIPHGVACAALLPHVVRANVEALRRADPRGTLDRYAEIGATIGDRRDPEAAIEATAAFVAEFSIPRLSTFGMSEIHIPDLVARAKQASSMQANPVSLSDDALAQCLRRAF